MGKEKIIMKPELYHFRCPINRYTFQVKKIRDFVEDNCYGCTLNLFAGKTKLNIAEIRNDSNFDMLADFHMDAFEFVKRWRTYFDTIILDPPYSYRKSMELYKGYRCSRFKLILDKISGILLLGGRVITLGYNSINMGKKRGFELEKLAVFSHGGAIHDTLCSIERYKGIDNVIKTTPAPSIM